MHFLIINNGTSSLNKIKKMLSSHSFEVMNFFNYNLSNNLSRFDAIILSGGHSLLLKESRPAFEKEIDIVLNSNLPIFGICFGFQLIAAAFGVSTIEMDNFKKGIFKINKKCEDDLFENVDDLNVFENHRKAIINIPGNFISLAYSKDGVEIFKHKEKMIYGVQFHPEMYPEKTCGFKIFENFLKKIENKLES